MDPKPIVSFYLHIQDKFIYYWCFHFICMKPKMCSWPYFIWCNRPLKDYLKACFPLNSITLANSVCRQVILMDLRSLMRPLSYWNETDIMGNNLNHNFVITEWGWNIIMQMINRDFAVRMGCIFQSTKKIIK